MTVIVDPGDFVVVGTNDLGELLARWLFNVGKYPCNHLDYHSFPFERAFIYAAWLFLSILSNFIGYFPIYPLQPC